MRVRVLAFASVADLLGGREREVEVPRGTTVDGLLDTLEKDTPRLARMRGSLMVSVNQDYVDRGQALGEGDEVALIPPVSGGAPAAPYPTSGGG